jgi:hypothetical protein
MRSGAMLVAAFLVGCGAANNAPPKEPVPDAIASSSVDAHAELERLVYKAIDARSTELWACYRKGLRDSSPPKSRVVIVLEIAQDGRATHVFEGHREGLGDEELRCMSHVLKARPFHDGAASTMRLQVPLTFTREGSSS